MNLDKLIEEGEKVRQSCSHPSSSPGGFFLKGEEYEAWIAKGIFFLERTYATSTLTERFKAAADRAVGNGESYYNTMIGVLKALKEFE